MTSPADDINPLIAAAREWYDAGYCVVPSHEDGSKRPFGHWKNYQYQRLQWDDLVQLLNTGKYTGIGVITGKVSGNVELIEIEGPIDEAIKRLNRVVDEAAKYDEIGMSDVLARIARGCVESSAGGGMHFLNRSPNAPVPGNKKLAADRNGQVVAETRGEGGFVIVAPTPARNGHDAGTSYMFVDDSHPSKTAEITSEERDMIHLLFELALNEHHEPPQPPKKTSSIEPAGDSTFDQYRSTPWRDILEPQGWTYAGSNAGRDQWVRPGKNPSEGISATTIDDGPMYVFSTNAGLPSGRGLSKAHVYAHYHHDGDLKAAARDLAAQGYGTNNITELAEWVIPASDNTPEPSSSAEEAYERLVREAAFKLKIQKDAKHLLARIELGNIAPLEGTDLSTFLTQEDEEEHYRVEGLWPSEGRVLLAAAAKSGKTTMVVGNLIPSLVDGTTFLGRFEVQPVERRIVLFNMEVGERTLRAWMRKSGIHATDKVTIVNLRGKASALQLGTEEGRDRLAQFLMQQQAEIVILDPLAPVLASLSIDENDNSQIAEFFSWWSAALSIAGVRDDLVVHHTGHAGNRSRGASRLLDEPDAIWTLKREEAEEDPEAEFQPIDRRYLHAYGRDVELPESALSFNPTTGHLTLIGGSPAQRRDRDRVERYYEPITEYLRDNPGASGNAIKRAVKGKDVLLAMALKSMEEDGLIDTVHTSMGSSHMLRDTPDTTGEKK